MTIRPPTDRAAGEPSAEELLALDAFLDALAGVSPAAAARPGIVDSGLVATARRLGDLSEAIWESAAPLFPPQPPGELAPVIELAPVTTSVPGRRRGGRPVSTRHGRRPAVVGWVATAAAVVVVLAVVGIHVFSGQPSTGPGTGASSAPAWRLTGFIDQSAWQQAGSSGPVASSVAVTCPVAGTCYADNPGGGQGAAVEATTDGGSSWEPTALPAGIRLTSSVACSSPQDCAVAGLAPGTSGAVVLLTADGGATWTTGPVSGASQLVSLACSTTAGCVAAGYGPPTAADPTGEAVTARSADGGATWKVTALAAGFSPSSPGGVVCAGQQCVLAGTNGATASSTGHARAAAWYSTDGGASWSPSTVPSGLAVLQAVSCTGPDCVGVAYEPTQGSTAIGAYGSSQAVASTDGGRTWTATGSHGLPVAELNAISCSTASQCWVSGFTGTTGSGSEVGVIASTTDGGSTWTTVTLPTTLTAAEQQASPLGSLDIQNVSSVSCATGGHCLAVASQGSSAEPGQQHLVLAN